jgi:hypothetical protein
MVTVVKGTLAGVRHLVWYVDFRTGGGSARRLT